MALKKRGKYWYGDCQADIRAELVRYGQQDEEVPTQFKDIRCVCGAATFRLKLDEEEGVAVRICGSCSGEQVIGDGAEYLEEAELEPCLCVCESELFEITVGLSLYEDSTDVRWMFVGCRCPSCGLTGTYGDWTCEFPGYQQLLERV